MAQFYVIALGSNRRHHRYGRPERVVAAALTVLGDHGVKVKRVARTAGSAPIGPSRRRYANSAALVKSKREPGEMLNLLKQVERSFGRRAGGQRWSARVLDLDIVLWNGGAYADDDLTIPHPAFRTRSFVLRPAAAIAPDWRDPLTSLTIRQLSARLTRAGTLPKRD